MWTRLPTVSSTLSCPPPFSFFFDLVEPHWKSPTSNRLTLHRVCTLARKQGATFVVTDSALTRADVCEEIDLLDASFGGGGSAEALELSFFSSLADPAENIGDIPSSALLGNLVVINYRRPGHADFTHSYIYEAILRPPTQRNGDGNDVPLLNNFICADGEFKRAIRGREFAITGIYYAQQNGQTHVCAHACLRMALNSIALPNPPISSGMINSKLNIAPPLAGLSLGQIASIIGEVDGVEASIVDCHDLEHSKFLTILASIVESGHVALLVFTTGEENIEHVVTVFGHTRNSDEWHPEAIPAYSGPQSTPYYPSSFWGDHFLIHDDNFGPYFAFSSRALEFDKKVRARHIIALHPINPTVRPDYAEGAAAVLLANVLPSLAPLASGRWFELMTRKQNKYVLRTLLVKKDQYLSHLTNIRAHDGTSVGQAELQLMQALPEWFWVVEVSLPQLYTGNRSKLGEILIDAMQDPDPNDLRTSLLAMRLPGIIVKRDVDGQITCFPSAMHSHAPTLQTRVRVNGQVW